MAYKLIVSPRAQQEIDNAINYYSVNSNDAPRKFLKSLTDAYLSLLQNPYKRIRYKNIRAFNLKTFPYVLYYTITKRSGIIKILACFHNKRNPENRPSL